jgi:tetratricopeptide (TPR) repeat protein
MTATLFGPATPLASPVSALRCDLERGEGQLSATAASVWLHAALIVQRLALGSSRWPDAADAFERVANLGMLSDAASVGAESRSPVDPARLDAQRGWARSAAMAAAGERVDAFTECVRTLAGHMEDAGALTLADSLLAAVSLVRPEASAIELARIDAQRARIARQLGALSLAEERYRLVSAHARRVGDAKGREELLARAHSGMGVVSLVRGNLPEATRQFRRASRAARKANDRALSRAANHGCLIVFAKRRMFSRALVHGWAAFADASPDSQAEAEALLNLGGVIALAGHPREALAAFLASLRRRPVTRVALPALGGAIEAAAALRDTRQCLGLLRRLDQLTRHAEFPWETADALLDGATACRALGLAARAAQYAARARELSLRMGFHEITYRSDDLLQSLPEPGVRSHPTERSSARSPAPSTDDEAPRGRSATGAEGSTPARLSSEARSVCDDLLALATAERVT